MNTQDIETELQSAQIRLAAAIRTQQELVAKEAELNQTRLTLASVKEDTAALQAQLKDAMERSVRNKLAQQDAEAARTNETRRFDL